LPVDLPAGLRRFREEHYPERRETFARLAEGQDPDLLFIGCSDSRVMPELLTGAGPGDMFVVRNVANVVPPFDPDGGHAGTSAAIEFAVAVLGVHDVVVCGHSGCGGVAALSGPPPPDVPHLGPWLDIVREALGGDGSLEDTIRRNVLLSIERLRGFPMVAERVAAGTLRLHGWYLDIGSGQVDVLDGDQIR
jgi:carbonic anhydrase